MVTKPESRSGVSLRQNFYLFKHLSKMKHKSLEFNVAIQVGQYLGNVGCAAMVKGIVKNYKNNLIAQLVRTMDPSKKIIDVIGDDIIITIDNDLESWQEVLTQEDQELIKCRFALFVNSVIKHLLIMADTVTGFQLACKVR